MSLTTNASSPPFFLLRLPDCPWPSYPRGAYYASFYAALVLAGKGFRDASFAAREASRLQLEALRLHHLRQLDDQERKRKARRNASAADCLRPDRHDWPFAIAYVVARDTARDAARDAEDGPAPPPTPKGSQVDGSPAAATAIAAARRTDSDKIGVSAMPAAAAAAAAADNLLAWLRQWPTAAWAIGAFRRVVELTRQASSRSAGGRSRTKAPQEENADDGSGGGGGRPSFKHCQWLAPDLVACLDDFHRFHDARMRHRARYGADVMALEARMAEPDAARYGMFIQFTAPGLRIPWDGLADSWLVTGFAGVAEVVDAAWFSAGGGDGQRRRLRHALARATGAWQSQDPPPPPGALSVLVVDRVESIFDGRTRAPHDGASDRIEAYVAKWRAAAPADRLVVVVTGGPTVDWTQGAWRNPSHAWSQARLVRGQRFGSLVLKR